MLDGRTAIITGAGTGIGAAVARRFADEGCTPILMGRRRQPLEEVADTCSGVVQCGDASSAEDVTRTVDFVMSRFGRLDILVANAGGFGFGTLTDTDDAAWASSVQANLNTAMVAARACMPALIEARGSIAVISSIAGLAAGPEACGYVTMKHALIGLMRSITRDYGPKGVRCNAICPGWVRTEMADSEMAELMQRLKLRSVEEAYALVTRNVPMGRPATAAEVANVVAFLCSGEAAMVAGSVMTVDGGSSAVDVPTLAFSD